MSEEVASLTIFGMSTSARETRAARAVKVRVTRETLVVDLLDGRTIMVPLAWYPRLQHGTVQERNRWRLIGRGEGIHWPDLDEDLGVDALLEARPSGESHASFQRWLASRSGTRSTRRTPHTPRKPGRG